MPQLQAGAAVWAAEIYDSVSSRLQRTFCRPAEGSTETTGLIDALDDRGKDVSTRLVILNSSPLSYHETIKAEFRLPDALFECHLPAQDLVDFFPEPDRVTSRAMLLRRTLLQGSDSRLKATCHTISVDIMGHVDAKSRFSAYLIDGPEKDATVIIMTADDPESDSEPALWLREALSLLTPDEISSADSNVCEYITHIARHIAFNLYLSTKFREVEESATWSVENELRRTLAVKKTLSGFEDQFLPFLARSEAVKGFLDDLKTWKEKCREQMDDLMQELHNSHLEKEAGVQDSNQLLEEAIGVKRLCFVATIFLPLTFTSSVFGMNVVQLGSGTAQIWAFIAVAVSVMAVTFIFLAVSHRLSIHPPTT